MSYLAQAKRLPLNHVMELDCNQLAPKKKMKWFRLVKSGTCALIPNNGRKLFSAHRIGSKVTLTRVK